MSSKRKPSTKKPGRNDPCDTSSIGEARPGVSDSPASPNNILISAPYANLANVAPDLTPSITPTDLQFGPPYATPWTWIWETMIEGFTLYSAAIYPTMFLPAQSWTAEEAAERWGKRHAYYTLGSNSRVRAKRARKELGWAPRHTSALTWIAEEMPL